NVFQYVNQFYFPRPDHKNKGDVVTIAWATTRSENIASIWLLEHLLDKLDSNEFAEVAAQNGFAQDADEERKEYFERLRDKFGLTLKEESKREIEFTRARDALAERYRLEGKSARARAVLNLRYGTFTDIGVKQAKKDETLIRYLNHNYKNYAEILRAREAKSLDPDVEATLPPMDSVELFPNFSLADFKRLTTMMEPVDSEKDYLELSQLRYWPDFRRALSMAEYARFANEIGIHQKLQKVFSMPLGVNEITLGEITTAYQSLLTGKVYKCLDAEWSDPCFIKEIKNRDGRVIFKNEVETKQVLSDTVTSQMAVMLRSVFTNGTARSQVANLSVSSEDRSTTLRFPVMGKTGTTNDYRNVAFMGALPTYVAEQNGIALDSVVAIGSYVGFDDNKPLKSGRTRIAGASGGLPQWAAFAKEEIDIQGIPEHIDFFDISMLATGEVPLVLPNERGELKVDPMTGFVLPESEASAGRSLPWLEVPGFTAVAPVTAEAEAGVVADSAVTAVPAAVTEGADSAQISIVPVEENAAAPAAETATVPATESATPAPETKTATPMPKDDDWDLPADLDGNNAFVPLEAGE
ncbi:MAG: peptidoglycan glycosyltransferase, partial [Fibrobacter sp.]|nr:peptidoglycan glycosyltransferase [Fibrobacter sp.]